MLYPPYLPLASSDPPYPSYQATLLTPRIPPHPLVPLFTLPILSRRVALASRYSAQLVRRGRNAPVGRPVLSLLAAAGESMPTFQCQCWHQRCQRHPEDSVHRLVYPEAVDSEGKPRPSGGKPARCDECQRPVVRKSCRISGKVTTGVSRAGVMRCRECDGDGTWRVNNLHGAAPLQVGLRCAGTDARCV